MPMTKPVEFDMQAAHRHFAAECFNRAWDLMDMPERTAAQDIELVESSIASHWHWTQRPDCTATNHSIGYWQIARAYALLGQAENARRFAQLCLEVSRQEGVEPFYLAYGYEALARAAALAGDRAGMQQAMATARLTAEAIANPEAKAQVLEDLEMIHLEGHDG